MYTSRNFKLHLIRTGNPGTEFQSKNKKPQTFTLYIIHEYLQISFEYIPT